MLRRKHSIVAGSGKLLYPSRLRPNLPIASNCGAALPYIRKQRPAQNKKKTTSVPNCPLSSLLHRKPRFHPPLLALGIMRYVGVAHGRQFTGGVFAGMSMRVRAVGYDFSILIGQYLWCKFLDFVGRNVQGSGNVGFAVAFRGKRLNHLDALVAV